MHGQHDDTAEEGRPDDPLEAKMRQNIERLVAAINPTKRLAEHDAIGDGYVSISDLVQEDGRCFANVSRDAVDKFRAGEWERVRVKGRGNQYWYRVKGGK